MNKKGPIIIIEDDHDDRELLSVVFESLNVPNEVVYFENGELALDYLIRTDAHPFLILSDVNMPVLSGFELRDKVYNNEALRLKCIPYLFFTTSAAQKSVIDAYSKSIQGFFVKPNSIEEIRKVLSCIVEYWTYCHSPNLDYNR